MNPITIKVRYSGGTYIARVLGKNLSASCTSDWENAAKAAARKWFGHDAFTVKRTGGTLESGHFFQAEAK